ncbi:MAG: alpha/beta hydrolase [Alphaproteobacteria bacterium]|nr:alpha/beta hydrolase [Alphaproteobacteria bacterium]MDE2041601.1 alpha/beta fold hydrolase [Alphaproteobacteria bacterium]MDE2339757.1 alpha/beta fold hydrolase [Alphaproteobacteria bacterium]
MSARPTLFFIHGMWSYAAVWDRMRTALEAQGFTTHAATLPGHDGMAGDLTRLGLADYGDALETQAKAHSNLVIIGHSMGGLLAQQLAARVQPRALVLLSTAPSAKIFSAYPSALRTMWPVIGQWGYWHRATMISMHAADYGISNGVSQAESVTEYRKLQPDSGRVAFEIGLPFLDRNRAAAVDYARLTMPTLLLCGENDRICCPPVSRATAKRIPGPVTLAMLPDFGHWIIGERGSPLVAARIAEFLESVSGPPENGVCHQIV